MMFTVFKGNRHPGLGSALFVLFLLAWSHAATAQEPSRGPHDPPADSQFPSLSGLDRFDVPGTDPSPVVMSARFLVEANGRRGVLQVAADIQPGWHIYSTTQQDGGPTRSQLILTPSSAYRQTGPFQADSAPQVIEDDLFTVPQEYFEDRVVWSAPIRLMDGVISTEITISGHLQGQACEEAGVCRMLDASMTSFSAEYAGEAPVASIAADSPTADPSRTAVAAPPAAPISGQRVASAPLTNLAATNGASATSGRMMKKLGVAFLAGLILNLMPCVLPVVGLKIMSFVQQAGQSPVRVFLLNLMFVLGLISVFMGLACLAAFAGWGWGHQFQRPEFSIGLASIVFVFALSFLGVWEIPIPGFSGKVADLSEREGLAGAFFKGVLTTVLATPCGGPLIVPALAWAAGQSKIVVFATFGSMGLGMGAPYLLFGLFPKVMSAILPKPGAWMETFKQVMGFFLLGTVVWIFSFIQPDFFLPTLALLFVLWAACWAVGQVPITAETSTKVRTYLASAGFAIILGVFSFNALLPSDQDWQPYTQSTLDQFRNKGTTVLVDFTADW